MRPRVFLRTAEFLWQEGHTAHATEEEAIQETLQMLDIYATFAERDLAIPVWKGPKPSSERFPGAVETYSIEAMMQDGKALQAGTSHFLGQNFAKAQNITFTDKTSQEAFCWTTSWGVSTRLIGGLIMTHADDDGLVLPPRIAPEQIVLLPIYRSDEDQSAVLKCCHKLKEQLEQSQWRNENIRVKVDDRDMRGGDKIWQHIKQGVPVRVEIGPRDLAAGTVSIARRDEPPKQKLTMPLEDFPKKAADLLESVQANILKKAVDFRESHSSTIDKKAEISEFFDSKQDTSGFAYVHVADDPAVAEALDPLKVTVRCTPMDWPEEPGKCLYTGKSVQRRSVISRSY
jgi:prolyl-tRNA synthetase